VPSTPTSSSGGPSSRASSRAPAHRGDPGHRGQRELRPEPDALCLRSTPGRGEKPPGRPGGTGGPQPDQPRRRLDQGVRRLQRGAEGRGPADFHSGRAAGAGGDRPRVRPAGRGARDDRRGNAARRVGRCGDGRARRHRDRRRCSASCGSATSATAPPSRRRKRTRTTSRAGSRAGTSRRPAWWPSGPASRPRSRPGCRSASAETWACSPTVRTCASSRRWSSMG
jgi:hypothetical protein